MGRARWQAPCQSSLSCIAPGPVLMPFIGSFIVFMNGDQELSREARHVLRRLPIRVIPSEIGANRLGSARDGRRSARCKRVDADRTTSGRQALDGPAA